MKWSPVSTSQGLQQNPKYLQQNHCTGNRCCLTVCDHHLNYVNSEGEVKNITRNLHATLFGCQENEGKRKKSKFHMCVERHGHWWCPCEIYSACPSLHKADLFGLLEPHPMCGIPIILLLDSIDYFDNC